jgi:hypothetical protein
VFDAAAAARLGWAAVRLGRAGGVAARLAVENSRCPSAGRRPRSSNSLPLPPLPCGATGAGHGDLFIEGDGKPPPLSPLPPKPFLCQTLDLLRQRVELESCAGSFSAYSCKPMSSKASIMHSFYNELCTQHCFLPFPVIGKSHASRKKASAVSRIYRS